MSSIRRSVIAFSILTASVATIAPGSVGQVDLPLGCQASSNGVAQVFSAAVSEKTVGFAPECVQIASGESVSWTNTDAVFHQPKNGNIGDDECFDFQVNAARTVTVKLEFNEDTQKLELTRPSRPPCDVESTLWCRSASSVGGLTSTCNGQPLLDTVEIFDDVVKFWYVCGFHGPQMHGHIEIARDLA
ncbi:MAG TPA: hypothetical protein VI997_05170 [Candidatus Thermoplasmatota archaeon]|nr:hypothetical protein [Candidatus Thermoplasmatota archaeon]